MFPRIQRKRDCDENFRWHTSMRGGSYPCPICQNVHKIQIIVEIPAYTYSGGSCSRILEDVSRLHHHGSYYLHYSLGILEIQGHRQ